MCALDSIHARVSRSCGGCENWCLHSGPILTDQTYTEESCATACDARDWCTNLFLGAAGRKGIPIGPGCWNLTWSYYSQGRLNTGASTNTVPAILQSRSTKRPMKRKMNHTRITGCHTVHEEADNSRNESVQFPVRLDGVLDDSGKMNGNICGERLPYNETCRATI